MMFEIVYVGSVSGLLNLPLNKSGVIAADGPDFRSIICQLDAHRVGRVTSTRDESSFFDTARVPEKLDIAIVVSSGDQLVAKVEHWLDRVVTGIDV